MIDVLTFIVEHSTQIAWIAFCAAVGGFFTPRFSARYAQNVDVDTWTGALVGAAVAILTAGLLDSTAGRVIGLAILAGVMAAYWLVVLRRVPRGARRSNWLLDHTLRRYRFDTFFGHFVSHVILLTWSLIVLAPIWTMLVNSLKDKRDIFRTPFDWPGSDAFTTAGYESAWVDGKFDVYFQNSLIVTVSSLMLILALGSSRHTFQFAHQAHRTHFYLC